MSNLVTRDKRWYGYTPDLPDQRDRPLLVARAKGALPKTVSLGNNKGFRFPIYDQGPLGSCTANAIAAAIEYTQRQQGVAEFTPSRLAIYYGEREIEDSIEYDAGAMIRDGMKVVSKQGCADEELWPYNIVDFTERPPEQYYTRALMNQVTSYERVTQTEGAIKTALAAGHPIVFGISVYESFESDKVAANGRVPLPAKSEEMIGGHAILMTGYAAQTVTFRNSWGEEWGRGGYASIPFDYILDDTLASDFWIVKVVEG